QLYVRAKQLLGSVRLPVIATDTAKIKQAIILLDEATARDPAFALAYCLLSEAHLDLYWQEPHSPIDRERAEKALGNAQRLASEAGETHFAQAYFHYCADH